MRLGPTCGPPMRRAKTKKVTFLVTFAEKRPDGQRSEPCVTICAFLSYVEWTGPGLNRRHLDFQSSALPTELPVQSPLLSKTYGVASECSRALLPAHDSDFGQRSETPLSITCQWRGVKPVGRFPCRDAADRQDPWGAGARNPGNDGDRRAHRGYNRRHLCHHDKAGRHLAMAASAGSYAFWRRSAVRKPGYDRLLVQRQPRLVQTLGRERRTSCPHLPRPASWALRRRMPPLP